MVYSPFLLASAVYGVLRRDGRVLLLRRAGSGYHDGELSLPAGHLDGGESVVDALARELREELDVEVDDPRLALVMHRAVEAGEDHEYLDLFFVVDSWSGTARIAEPDKCTELVWALAHDLPGDVIGYVRAALAAIETGRQRLLLDGW